MYMYVYIPLICVLYRYLNAFIFRCFAFLCLLSQILISLPTIFNRCLWKYNIFKNSKLTRVWEKSWMEQREPNNRGGGIIYTSMQIFLSNDNIISMIHDSKETWYYVFTCRFYIKVFSFPPSRLQWGHLYVCS